LRFRSNYRPDIDGLRALAIVPVVVFHAFPAIMPGGFFGVDVFFVISGFLISGIVLQGCSAEVSASLVFMPIASGDFFQHLFIVLAASFTCGWFFLLPDEYVCQVKLFLERRTMHLSPTPHGVYNPIGLTFSVNEGTGGSSPSVLALFARDHRQQTEHAANRTRSKQNTQQTEHPANRTPSKQKQSTNSGSQCYASASCYSPHCSLLFSKSETELWW
jgi:hypothetical protein